jgi:hypothetical protein
VVEDDEFFKETKDLFIFLADDKIIGGVICLMILFIIVIVKYYAPKILNKD